jgi:hypothetical protein
MICLVDNIITIFIMPRGNIIIISILPHGQYFHITIIMSWKIFIPRIPLSYLKGNLFLESHFPASKAIYFLEFYYLALKAIYSWNFIILSQRHNIHITFSHNCMFQTSHWIYVSTNNKTFLKPDVMCYCCEHIFHLQ